MNRAHRTIMACVHRLQEVEDFRPTNLTHDDAFRAHTQTVLDEVGHGDRALALKVGRACFESHDMRLLQLQVPPSPRR